MSAKTREEIVVLIGGPLDGAGHVVRSTQTRTIRIMVGTTVHTYERIARVGKERARFRHVRVR